MKYANQHFLIRHQVCFGVGIDIELNISISEFTIVPLIVIPSIQPAMKVPKNLPLGQILILCMLL